MQMCILGSSAKISKEPWILDCEHVPPCAAQASRDHVVQAVELKFNCFFLMPVVDAFPSRLRAELEVRM